MVNEGDLVYLIPEDIAARIPFLIDLLQAIGIFIIIYIIFSIVNTIIARKRNKEIEKINFNLTKINGEMNKNLREIKSLLKKKKEKNSPK